MLNKLARYSINHIRSMFSGASFAKGELYANEGRVSNIVVDANMLSAQVRGSSIYRVNIYFNDSKGILKGSCSCPVPVDCKHIIATILFARKQNEESVPKINTNNIIDVEIVEHIAPSNNYWLESLNDVSPNLNHKPIHKPRAKSKYRLVFVLIADRNDRAKIEIYYPYIKADGSYGANPKQHDPQMLTRKNQFPKSFTQEDCEIVRLLTLEELEYTGSIILNDKSGKGYILELIIKTGKCHFGSLTGDIVELSESKKGELYWKSEIDGRQKMSIRVGQNDDYVIIKTPSLYYIEDSKIGKITLEQDSNLVEKLLNAPSISPLMAQSTAMGIKQKFGDTVPTPHEYKISTIKPNLPTGILTLKSAIITERDYWSRTNHTIVVGSVEFDYKDFIIPVSEKREEIIVKDESEIKRYKRIKSAESKIIKYLDKGGLVKLSRYSANYYIKNKELSSFTPNLDNYLDSDGSIDDFWIDYIKNIVPKLKEKGWRVIIAEDFPYINVEDQFDAEIIEKDNDWFSLNMGVMVDGVKIDLARLFLNFVKTTDIENLLEQEPKPDQMICVDYKKNKKLILPAARIWHILRFIRDITVRNTNLENVEFSKYDAGLIAEFGNDNKNINWVGGERVRVLGARLKDFKSIESLPAPKTLSADLRDYQIAGLSWLSFLQDMNLGGILADDMGLGKTIQTLSLLCHMQQEGKLDSPALVVAPTSVIDNWKIEAERFAPSLKILMLYGLERHELFRDIPKSNLVITSYNLMVRDSDILLDQEFSIIVLDEAHYIKNAKTKVNRIACKLKSDARIALSGTPVENHLEELWAQFNFLMPGFLGSQREFKQIFRTPIEKQGDRARCDLLKNRVKCFMLRRTKDEVLKSLPNKTEMIRSAKFSKEQRDVYEAVRITMDQKVRDAIESQGLARSHLTVLDGLLKLRQICCDPILLKKDSIKASSAKLEMLMEMLDEMISEGRRILLFSQFTEMLSIIEQRLIERKYSFVKLTGASRNRAGIIEEFQSGKASIFLISLKAGGVGINLTSADTVIHYDPWWNPAAEDQATSRAYRIGQDKPVFIYKLITSGTVEEKIIEMQNRKRILASSLHSEGPSGTSLSFNKEDINALFKPISDIN